MEASAVMHCSSSSLLDCSIGLLTTMKRRRRGALRLKENKCSSCSFVWFRRSESSFRSPVLEWRPLQSLSPRPAASRLRTNSLSQHTVNSAKCAISNEKSERLEEDHKLLLKKNAKLIGTDLRGTCIFLVGMMGSGKTTVGKYIADALGYYFFDSDKLVEDAAGGVTVQQMFREGNEDEFRNAETEVLMQLSSLGRLVVATGGGAVVRPQNWGYLRHGITVWLDVPVEALARRVVAVGCESRPLLGQVSPETAYHQAFNCLESLFVERVGYYKNADAQVSVAGLATIMGLEDVSGVTPAMIAAQVLEEISLLIRQSNKYRNYQGKW